MQICFYRRLFHLYTYFFLFYNSVFGLATALRRIVISFTVPLFFLPRLDRPLVIRGVEFLDKGHPFIIINALSYKVCFNCLGYVSFLAYIQVEAAYTNPVLNVFIHLLMNHAQVKLPKKTTHGSDDTACIDIRSSLLTKPSGIINPSGHCGCTPLMDISCLGDDVTINKVARRRWYLMYTLIY